MSVRIIGGGLAGSEAAWQLAKRGIKVELFEMRPSTTTKAHKTGKLAELVCSNSFRGSDLSNAVGLLKEELRLLDSLIMTAADYARVPAGGALAVDRVIFSEYIDAKLRDHPFITLVEGELMEIPECDAGHPLIIATGPLTGKSLSAAIATLIGSGQLSFYDAISPIVLGDSLNLDEMFKQSRYDKGEGDDYLNIPLSREQYSKFIADVAAGEKFGGHNDVESESLEGIRPFEGCMPIEDMIERGPETLLFGPMKPVGLTDPKTGKRPHAVIQLRQDDKEGKLWSMVGFQTRLRQGEQTRIFRELPGMGNAEFVRLGTVHRNTFINSPECLNPTLQFRGRPGLFFAGQITGVEGYVESTAGGLVAGLNAARLLNGEDPLVFPLTTAIGSLMSYISDPERKHFQPMNVNYGLMPGYLETPKVKGVSRKDKRHEVAQQALTVIREFL